MTWKLNLALGKEKKDRIQIPSEFRIQLIPSLSLQTLFFKEKMDRIQIIQ